jgi:hypothetical protein
VGDEKAYRILPGYPEGKRPFARSKFRWEDNIKMDSSRKNVWTVNTAIEQRFS